MKAYFSYKHAITLLSALTLLLLLSACAKQVGDVTPDQLPVPTKPANGQGSASSSSDKAGSASTGEKALPSTITYKSVNITIVSTDQQKQFSDDTQSSGPVVLRVNLREQNPTAQSIYLFYDESMRLVLPDGRILAPKTAAAASIERSVVRNSWLDFSLDSKQDVNKLILRVGTANEHRMDVPLTRDPDLTKYQARFITPNAKLHYVADWTITKVTTSLSADGEQAEAGKRYIIVTLSADNSSDNAFYPFPADNFRLKTKTVTQAPKNTTLPSNLAPHSTGTTGTVTFLVPENDTDLQLQFLAQPKENIKAASTSFRI